VSPQSRRALIVALSLLGPAGGAVALAQDPPPPAPPAPAPAPAPKVCDDPALACPDLRMAPPTDLRLARSPSGRTILRAENRIVNVGRGPLEVRARRGDYGDFPDAEQVVQRRDGGEPLRVPGAGRVTFKFVDGYRGSYWKYQDAARFELWTRRADGSRDRMVRTGPKLAYCFRDLDKVRSGPRVPPRRVYPACTQRRLVDAVRLGTSVGWADVYPAPYPENWIDVTGLRGCFVFVHRADPGGSLVEEREDNNLGLRTIALPPRKGRVAPAGRC
jgi:hypothetical protein